MRHDRTNKNICCSRYVLDNYNCLTNSCEPSQFMLELEQFVNSSIQDFRQIVYRWTQSILSGNNSQVDINFRLDEITRYSRPLNQAIEEYLSRKEFSEENIYQNVHS